MSPADATLLVVDDNEDNRYTLTRRLKREGYTNLTTANDGKQALELLRSQKFDLMLLDIMMPEMNGYEVLEHLKGDDELRHLPVIVISAVGEIESVVRCIELGAEDYLHKPFDATLLRARVGASLEKKRLRDADRSTLFLYDRRSGELFSRVAEGLTTKEIRFPSNAGVAGAVFTSSKSENIVDPYSDRRFNKDVDRSTGYRTESMLTMAIVNKAGACIGVTQVLNKRGGKFSGKDESRLGAFTAQITVALENAKLFEEVLHEKNYNDSILRSTSDGIVTLDAQEIILTANAAALRIFEHSREEIVDRPAREIFRDQDAWVLRNIDKVRNGGNREIAVGAELRLDKKNPTSVNLASRLEGVTKTYGCKVLISEATRLELKEKHLLRAIDLLRVKGKTEPIAIYEAMDHFTEESFPKLERSVAQFNDGIINYRAQKWNDAIACFNAALSLHPGDKPSRVFLTRSERFREEPPPPDWDGVWVMTEK